MNSLNSTTTGGAMIQNADGQPLISKRLASIVIGALLAPSLIGVFWLRGWVSTVDEKLETVITNQRQTRAEMYPRTEASLQWQYNAQQMEELKGRVAVIDARTRREDFQRADQPEARRMR